MVGYMTDEREEKGISRHLEKVKDPMKGNFRGGIAGEYATPSKIGRDESKYFGKERSARRSPDKVCPMVHKKFEDFATVAPSDEELQYYCPYCDALVIREFDDMGERKIEVYDWSHMPD